MIDYSAIIVFAIISGLTFYGYVNGTRIIISEVGINKKFYPQRYIMSHRSIAKFFKIKRKPIPKYLYFELFAAIVCAMFFQINTIIYLCTNGNMQIADLFIRIHVGFVLIDSIYGTIWFRIYKKI